MRGRLFLTLILPGFAGIFALAVGAGYLMGQTAFRPSVPRPGPAMPTTFTPGLSSPSSAEPQPQPSPFSPDPLIVGEQPGGALLPLPQTEPPASPGPAQPPAVDVQPAPAVSAPPPVMTPGGGPTTSPPIPEPPSRFHVQVGAFDDRGNAGAMVDRLRARGYAVTLVEGPPYRVWVGGYLDRSTAERLSAHLKAAGFEVTLSPR